MEDLNKWIVTIIVIAVIILVILIYNILFRKRNKVKTAFASIDVMLKKRYDVMPNLVSMVQKYMVHESDVLTRLTELREKAKSTNSIDESIKLNKEIDNQIKKIELSVEGYPDLKASKNFLQMQATLNDIEEQISAARRTYNAHVEEYNNFIGMIPINIFAIIFRFKKYELFEANLEERESKIWM